MNKYWLWLLFLAVIVSRIPFLWSGYGADSDCWLVAKSAVALWNQGEYHPSRLPGYPLHEFVSAPLIGIGGGSLLSNGATLLVTLLAIGTWAKFSRWVGKHPKILVVAFAFAPSLWQHSAETIDYVWSLLFILLALNQVRENRPLLSGLLVGCAAGFRPSNIVAVIPIMVFVLLHGKNNRDVLKVIVGALATTFIAFLPLLLKYGGVGWIVATRNEMADVTNPTMTVRLSAFVYRVVYFIGPLTCGLLGYVFWRSRNQFMSELRKADSIVVTSVVGVAVFLLMFLWLPLERAYLLPALPFLLLLVDRFAAKRMASAFVALLILSSLLTIDIVDKVNRRSFRLNVHPGMVIEEYQIRSALLEQMKQKYGV